ncbi:uncharacterized protein EAE97_009222 [Botrytis byssoidea]|uniref:Uncharacterized protein n=1 Tax=Botrytis byssoidea TaxID=139641 RepID=A0A9P5LWF8_9HELO|nr:uncharacterized protein EAE97_009222 [Botrytis byssoidea]KAF7931013.1 hypothetical protein EAE97_009222 [Botrytis byssoidea]
MGQPVHDSSLCDRAKRCINNISDCSSSQHDRKRVRLSYENQGPPVNESIRPTVPIRYEYVLAGAVSNPSPSDGYFPAQSAPNQTVATYQNPINYAFFPIPEDARQNAANPGVPGRSRVYEFVQVPTIPDEDVASPGASDVSSQTALEQAISESRQAIIQTDADKALVNEFATVLAIASQIPVHHAAAMQRPVRFTVNQSMAPSPGILFLQITSLSQGRELIRRWEVSDYAHVRINEISFTLGDDSDNQTIAANQNATFLTDQAAADQALMNQAITGLANALQHFTGTASQVTASFFMMLYSRLYEAGGSRREMVRRWIQSGNARLPVNINVPGFAVASVENSNGAQITQTTIASRAREAMEAEFQRRIRLERQSISLFQQEHGNDASLRHRQEEPGAVEQLRDENQDSDAANLFPHNPFFRGFTGEEIHAQILTNQRSRRGMNGASSGEDRRMEMSNRGRRNAIQLGSRALFPGNNDTVTDSGPQDVDGS